MEKNLEICQCGHELIDHANIRSGDGTRCHGRGCSCYTFRPAPQGIPEKVSECCGVKVYDSEGNHKWPFCSKCGKICYVVAPQKQKDPEPISAQIEGWEERFDKSFTELNPDMGLNETMLFDPTTSLIKDFIRAEIKKERANTIAECIEIVEELRHIADANGEVEESGGLQEAALQIKELSSLDALNKLTP